MKDLTASKKTEKELAEKEMTTGNFENALKELSDIKHALAASTIVAFTDQKGKITYVNGKFCKISGYSREELLGQDHRIINSGFHEKDFFRNLWTTISKGKIWNGEICNRAKNGSLYWVSTTIVPFVNEEGKPYQYVAIRHDITKQKNAETTILQKENHLKAILDTAPDCIKLLDSECRIESMNASGLKMLEAESIEELQNKQFQSFVLKKYHEEFEKMIREVFEGKSNQIEYEIQGFKGTHRWFETNFIPFRNEPGQIAYALGITKDISDRKISEALIIKQEEMIEQTYDAIYSWRLDDGIIYWNQSAEKLYGYLFDEVKGMEVYEVLETEYGTSFDDYFEKLKRDGFWEGEIKQKAKNGKKIYVESRQRLNETIDGITIVLETSRDITERKQANERIRQQASLLEKTRDAIIVCDLNHKIIFWNHGAEEIYGRKEEEVLGREIREKICNGDKSVIDKALSALEKTDDWQEEATNFTKEGKEITVISRWTLVRNELGKPDYYLINNTDISDLKHTEHQLLRAQRLESIGTLAGGIAHDLNNVLSPILMTVDMLETDLELPESSLPWLSIIRENTERGADLIKQVLTFARGAEEGNREQIQIAYLIKELVSMWKNTLPPNIKIEYNIKPQLPLISSDSTQIHQILMNLVVNAKDAMRDSGGTLKIAAENVEIDENYSQINPNAEIGKYVLITVEDTGTGMSPKTLEQIWDPFFTTKDIGEGTGLGLSTTRSIVKANGGFINAYSELSKGTKFSIYLPVVESSDNDERIEKQIKSYPRGNGELILIVDDEEYIRRVTSATLEKFGYKTLTAIDGTEAVGIYSQQEKIDLVITDMAMPYMDGAATIWALRKMNPDQIIIAASGLTTAQQTKSKELSVNDFLAKPFTSEKLLTAIAKVLSDA